MWTIISVIITLAAIPKLFGIVSVLFGNLYNVAINGINSAFTPKNKENKGA